MFIGFNVDSIIIILSALQPPGVCAGYDTRLCGRKPNILYREISPRITIKNKYRTPTRFEAKTSEDGTK